MGESASSGVPQFATAEYSGRPGDVTCKSCVQKISGTFYRVNGAPVCAECTQRLQQTMPQDSHQAFVRGVLFGAGAAVAGFAIYVVFAIATGLVAGIVSLAVGYLVGKAIERGSGGVGGRRYQIAAALLTYMAVSLAAVPIALSVHMKHNRAQQQAQAAAPAARPAAAPETTPASASASAPATPAAAATAPAAPAAPSAPKVGFAKAVGLLALLGLASPFLDLADPAHGIIGLIILLVGIRIAWRLTAAKPLHISGPITERAPAASG
jgi:hypothetical protein